MPELMKAAYLINPGKMEVREVPIPEPEPGWVRIKVKACGICGSDMHYYKGNFPELDPKKIKERNMLGRILGHESSGIIDKLGQNVNGLREGDRVAVIPPLPCMKCEYCRVGLYEDCESLAIIGYEYSGAFAEYVLVPKGNVYIIPDNISFEEAATLDVIGVGIHATHRGKVTMADKVCVLGAGAIGIALIAAAKKAGARDILVTAKHPIQKEIVKKMGIREENIINPENDEKARREIFEKTDNFGVDCVLESVGVRGSVIEFGISILRKGGRLVFTGLFEEKVNLSFWDVLIKDASIITSGAYGMWGLVPEFNIAAEMLARGEFPAKDIITHKFPIDQINEAFQQKLKPDERNKTIKVEIVY